MHDFIIGALVIIDALIGIVTWRGVGTAIFCAAIIFGFLAVFWIIFAVTVGILKRMLRL